MNLTNTAKNSVLKSDSRSKKPSVYMQYSKCFLFMTFFVRYVASVRLGQLMTSLETSTNALYTPTYRLLRLTISGKTNILRKTRWRKRPLDIYLLKETLPELMISFFSSRLSNIENILVFCTANKVWLYIKLRLRLN